MRKLIPITPEYLPDYGDCLSAILYKIFKYFEVQNYELIFAQEGHIQYFPAEDPTKYYDVNNLLQLTYCNYYEILEECLNIKTYPIDRRSVNEITKLIDKTIPVIIMGSSADMPWRHSNSREEAHSCLIIGYDKIEEDFICIDPILEGELLYLPFSNFNSSNTKMSCLYLDLANYKVIEPYNLSDLTNYFKSIDEKQYSWDCFTKLVFDITRKVISGELKIPYCTKYILENRQWFFLMARSKKVTLFFRYLHGIYGDETFKELASSSLECVSLLKKANLFVLKFCQDGNKDNVLSMINMILKVANVERRMNDLIDEYIKSFLPKPIISV